MNKKGFTLVELLAAITILALLALITVPAVTKPIKDSKDDLYNSQLRTFRDSAKSWGADNMFSVLPSTGYCILVPLDVLIEDGFVEPDVKSPLDAKVFSGDGSGDGVFVKIDNQGSTANRYVYTVWDCDGNTCHNPDEKEGLDYDEVKGSCTIYQK